MPIRVIHRWKHYARSLRVEIEKDIAIPEPYRAGPITDLCKLAYKMKAGESLLCDSLREREIVRGAIKRMGGRACSRKVHGGWRVWRTDEGAT